MTEEMSRGSGLAFLDGGAASPASDLRFLDVEAVAVLVSLEDGSLGFVVFLVPFPLPNFVTGAMFYDQSQFQHVSYVPAPLTSFDSAAYVRVVLDVLAVLLLALCSARAGRSTFFGRGIARVS